MAKSTAPVASLEAEVNHYLAPVSISDHLPLNVGLSAAQESTMISTLGAPLMPLTKVDQPSRVSPAVKKILQTVQVSKNITVTGIKPAVESLKRVLSRAFAQEMAAGHSLESVLSSHDMLNVRLRNPTSGKPSTKISNHAWGTAIDFKIVQADFPGNTGQKIPMYIAVLLPFFNEEGWYSGIAFHDTMHFEVAEETIRTWASQGLFK